MRHYALAAASLLVLTLAACSGSAGKSGATPSPKPNASATPDATPTPAMNGSAMPMSGAGHPKSAGNMPMMKAGGAPAPTASSSPYPPPAPPPPSLTKIAATDAPPAFAQCSVCHSVKPGVNIIGPSLYGVYGRKSGSEPGFHYSAAMKKLDVTWNAATLNRWLTNPQAMAPGTIMAMPGVKDPAKRQAIIAYLKTLKG